MEQKKSYPKPIGAVWSKQSSTGNEYLSIQVEINGVKHNFTAFKNRFYEDGGKKPMFEIAAPRIESNEVKTNSSYNAQPIYQATKSPIKSNEADEFPF